MTTVRAKFRMRPRGRRTARWFLGLLATLTGYVLVTLTVQDFGYGSRRWTESVDYLSSTVLGRKSDSNIRRQTLILAIGPRKTGTTFLQSSLCTQHATDVLQQDGWRFLGVFPSKCGNYSADYKAQSFVGHNITDFFDTASNNNTTNSTTQNTVVLSPIFADELEAVQHAGQNAILINEHFASLSEEQLGALAGHLSEHNWNVYVLLTYRRLYEWLPSSYNQMFRPGKHIIKNNSVNINWPFTKEDDGTLHFDLENRGKFSTLIQQIEAQGRHPVERSLHRYRRFFSNITIIDQHNLQQNNVTSQGDPYLQHLLCQVMGLVHTCAAAQAGQPGGPSADANPSTTLDYDILAVRAWQRNILPLVGQKDGEKLPLVSRKSVVRAIRRYHNQTQTEFPQQCLANSTLDRLLNLSLTAEANFFSVDNRIQTTVDGTDDRIDHYNETRHRAEFERTRYKFCHVNADRVLDEDSGLMDILSTLGRRNTTKVGANKTKGDVNVINERV